jgi:hypothetical protein
MATSHTTPAPHRRPEGDRGLDSAAAPDSIPTPSTTDENTSGHTDVRGAPPVAEPIPEPTNPQHHRAAPAVRDVDDPDIDAALDAVVDAAPPLPYEVRARLAWLLRGQHHQPPRDKAA